MRSTIAFYVCALAASGFAPAQEAGNRVFVRTEVGPVPHASQDVVMMTFGEKPVTGKPYSAEGVTEFTQKLADGTTITRKNTSTVYRDSQGRTRREQTIDVIGPWVAEGEAPKAITITDPVAGEAISLNPRDKVARRLKLPAPPLPPEGTVSHAEGPKQIRMEKQVRVQVEAGEGPGTPPEMETARYDVLVHRGPGESKTEKLGTQTIEGVLAEGTRTTSVIPAGAIGNDRPITTVSTRWYSNDIQALVLGETDDPLAGKTVFRLTNIRQAEPPADLFQVPPDYTVRDGKDLPGKVTIMRREAK